MRTLLLLLTGAALCTQPNAAAQSSGPANRPVLPALYPAQDTLRSIIHLIGSSHQDIAWMDSPEKCREQRDVRVITPALKIMQEHPDFRYGMENTLNLVEYLERHPERREEVTRLTREGRMEWGATYNQPYESLLSGEQLVRELYFGRKWIRKNLPGCDARVSWNPDVPGRAIQMQQILAKAGVPYLMISRHKENLFRWNSPDGSGVIAYTPGHYYNHSLILADSTPVAARKLEEKFVEWEKFFAGRNMRPQFGVLNSADAAGPQYFGKLVDYWNARPSTGTTPLPLMRHSSAFDFFRSVDVPGGRLDTIVGERPNVWLYIHGPTHHWAISAKRKAGVLLPAAEAFSTIDAILAGSWNGYPEKELTTAWAASIYDDHGWGGNQGQVTDQLFRSKADSARTIGQKILDRALGNIAARVKTGTAQGTPVVVFNALSWPRTEPVRVILPSGSYRIVDVSGKTVPSQAVMTSSGVTDGGTTVTFVAQDVPSLGYATYHAVQVKSAPAIGIAAKTPETWDSRHYRIGFAPGGLRSIFDRELKRELLKTDKFLGGEIFTMRSVGTGAGEFTEVQQPTMEGFDKLSNHAPVWRMEENGPVYTSFSARQPLSTCTIVQKVTIYHDVKRIDVAVSILGWNGDRYREFRMALPLAMQTPEVTYQVPMGVVRFRKDEIPGAAGFAYGKVNYAQPVADVRPREVQNFVSASDGFAGVTMSSDVAVMDFIDPTDHPVPYPVLQPILLASRRSCHGLGNWYLQEGDHYYSFSLFSHTPGWTGGYRQAIGANDPLIAVVPDRHAADASLPAVHGFLSVSAKNWIVTALKKCDDDNSVVLRLYDIEGKDAEGTVRFPVPLARASTASIIEDDGAEVPHNGSELPLKIGHHAIETFKVMLEH
jgi:alpha-mannosidase